MPTVWGWQPPVEFVWLSCIPKARRHSQSQKIKSSNTKPSGTQIYCRLSFLRLRCASSHLALCVCSQPNIWEPISILHHHVQICIRSRKVRDGVTLNRAPLKQSFIYPFLTSSRSGAFKTRVVNEESHETRASLGGLRVGMIFR